MITVIDALYMIWSAIFIVGALALLFAYIVEKIIERVKKKWEQRRQFISGDITKKQENGVIHFVSNGASNIGNVIPRYNQDGTLKTNNKCLNDLKNKGE